MCLLFVVFATVFLCLTSAQSPCTTPTGEEGRCISVNECLPLFELVNKKTPSGDEKELLKKSRCKIKENTPAVCCPKLQTACNTPEGYAGKCVSIDSCSHLKGMLKTPLSEETVSYLQKSKCTGFEQYSVCCGPPPISANVRDLEKKNNCETQINAFPPDPHSYCCGESLADPRIKHSAKGNPATIEDYPWMAIIEYQQGNNRKLLCGGVLISGKYLLTAAHCVVGKILEYSKPFRVHLGEHNISNVGPDCELKAGNNYDCTDGVTIVEIENVIPHPQFDPLDFKKGNDIALIRLKETVPFTDFIRPVCLPISNVTAAKLRPNHFSIYGIGWGNLNETNPLSDVKTFTDLEFITQDVCQEAYSNYDSKIIISQKQLCAGGTKGRNSCNVDSGGPLLYESDKIFQVIGIKSFGPVTCDLDGIPGVYSKVYEYIDWIRSTIVP